MGKRYESEISKLADTYAWALRESLDSISGFVNAGAGVPLYTVGSGGSYSAAAFAAFLSQYWKHRHAAAITPLEMLSISVIRHASVLIFSAGGNNPDVIQAFRTAISQEPRSLGVVCLRRSSKLSRIAENFEFVHRLSKNSPAGKDGFLATNSLLAFCVFAHRLFCPELELPKDYADLESLCVFSAQRASAALKRDTLVVLYGASTKAAALDLESKMSEAALASVQLADFRNFAHGRHHWIAKRGSRTGVIAFLSRGDEAIGRRTLALLEKLCPTVTVHTSASPPLASLSLLPAIFQLTSIAGNIRKIDPGRPGVPEFGRRLYHLRTTQRLAKPGSTPSVEVVVARKTEFVTPQLLGAEVARWSLSAESYIQRLQSLRFQALAIDFDDTLCGSGERFGKLRPDVTAQLERLAKHNILIGIATGRGKSVRKQMQESLNPACWQDFVIAYYNGSEVGNLADNSYPRADIPPMEPFNSLGKCIESDPILAAYSSITLRAQQITLEPHDGVAVTWLWREVLRAVSEHGRCAKVIHSSRSVDVVSQVASKTALLESFVQRGISQDAILCIGDLGQFPGNDFELLRNSSSVSCYETSGAADACWNFAPVGFRGVQATLYYLSHLKAVGTGEVQLQIGITR
jgi:fructoselysine-6-P-deglycase FrlB-like protein